EERAFSPGLWSLKSYENLWRQWDAKAKEAPKDYPAAVRQRYGLHPAPYANGSYPMGIREGKGLFGKALTADCMLCHAGSILGQSYVGLGNSTLDIQALFEDLGGAGGGTGKTPFVFSFARGTSEAGSFAVYLLSLRDPETLKLKLPPADLDIR